MSSPISEPRATPITAAERITSLDSARGLALLGILLMNIVPFGLYHGAYDNPTSAGGSSGVNLWTWYVLHVLGEGKMRCLFSLIFGASAVVFTSRLDHRLDGADIYYRRTLWLMVFGIAHGFLLWQGEILFPYALCGLVLYPFRKMGPRGLTTLAAALLLYCSVFYGIQGKITSDKIAEGKAAVAKAENGEELTGEEQEARIEYERMLRERNPSPEDLAKDASEWRGNPLQVIKTRGSVLLMWVSIPFYHAWNMDVLAAMLLGMALMKWGVLSGDRTPRFYARLMIAGYAIGIPIHAYNGWIIIQSNFDAVIQYYAGVAYDAGRVAVTFGHVGLIYLFVSKRWLPRLMRRLCAVGQLALTNYVTHSIVCAFIFTGYGFGLYGTLERFQLYYVVAAIWVVQLIASPIWLEKYRFGPLEWCWRSLTYWKRQPLRLVPAAGPSAPARRE